MILVGVLTQTQTAVGTVEAADGSGEAGASALEGIACVANNIA